jgi:nucleoid-associated protein YgaU
MAEGYAKARFERLDAQGNIAEVLDVQFNPTELGSTKAAQLAEIAIPGLDSPLLQFVRGQTEQVNLELFFDSTELGTGAVAVPVTTQTNRFYALVKMSGSEHAPPRCRFVWGDEFPGLVSNDGAVGARRRAFECVVESIQQKFTLFSPTGLPLRATLSVALREYQTLRAQLERLNLQTSDHTQVHTVQLGETLPKIAWDLYRDPTRWPLIAEANHLLRPRDLTPGQVLVLPPTTVGAGP